jgi:hypothetical protein
VTNRTDNFNRADGAIGTPSDAGSAWVQNLGTWNVLTNQARITTNDTHATCVLESSVSNVEVQATIPTVGGGVGHSIVARCADSSNFIMFQIKSASVEMWKRVGGSFTQLGTTVSNTFVANDVIKLTCDGNTINGYVNGVLKIGPITESAGSTNTKHGLYANQNSTGRFDDFSITEITAGGGGDALMGQICI